MAKTKKVTKKRIVVVEPVGEAHVNATFNNIIITLTNLQGQTVWSFNKPFNGTLQVDLQLERGVYFVIAYGAWKKLIIQ